MPRKKDFPNETQETFDARGGVPVEQRPAAVHGL